MFPDLSYAKDDIERWNHVVDEKSLGHQDFHTRERRRILVSISPITFKAKLACFI